MIIARTPPAPDARALRFEDNRWHPRHLAARWRALAQPFAGIVDLVLVLPGLVAPSTGRAARPPMPAAARLLALAGAPTHEPEGIGAVLARRYGIARQDDWPLAPLRLAALGADPRNAWWIAADPVTLVAGRDDVHVAGAVTDLAAAQSDSLVAALNAHFAADDLLFVAPRPGEWFARSPATPRLVTHDLACATGRALRALLPEGPDAGRWRRWLSEIQMLLHAHPVNAAREASGGAPVNSVWFSGGGTLPPRTQHQGRVATWASEGIATALALHHGTPARTLPPDLAGALREGDAIDTHVVAFARSADLAVIERMWFVPAWDALMAGRPDCITIVVDGAGDACSWTLHRPGRWQRLRVRHRRHDLDALLDAARIAP